MVSIVQSFIALLFLLLYAAASFYQESGIIFFLHLCTRVIYACDQSTVQALEKMSA